MPGSEHHQARGPQHAAERLAGLGEREWWIDQPGMGDDAQELAETGMAQRAGPSASSISRAPARRCWASSSRCAYTRMFVSTAITRGLPSARRGYPGLGNPVGIGLANEIDTGMAMRTIMYAFGASVQDQEHNLVLGGKPTLEAVKFVKALFQEAMTPEVFTWDASSNNRAMIAGRVSLALNAISITRTAEKDNPDMSGKIQLTKALQGPARAIGLEHVMQCYVAWKFAENIDGAKQFLVDYTSDFRQAFRAGEFYDFPCFPNTVPDLKTLIANDPEAHPPDKYTVLGDVTEWATNVGYPGYANAAIDEIFGTWVINVMFAKAASGSATPEEALREAEVAAKRIFGKWKEKGLV
jgi:multiple sugar transport system substrate-binding protein